MSTGMVDLSGGGTPEQAWQSWHELAGRPKLRMPAPPATAVVIAPHPDDEVLGVGGLLTLLARTGTAVHIVAVTDGEASHPESPTLTPRALAARRIAESAARARDPGPEARDPSCGSDCPTATCAGRSPTAGRDRPRR